MELAVLGGGGISLSPGGINYLWDDVIVHKYNGGNKLSHLSSKLMNKMSWNKLSLLFLDALPNLAQCQRTLF